MTEKQELVMISAILSTAGAAREALMEPGLPNDSSARLWPSQIHTALGLTFGEVIFMVSKLQDLGVIPAGMPPNKLDVR
jgi:hypothetical protein